MIILGIGSRAHLNGAVMDGAEDLVDGHG
jgi:hypothetical protein